MDDVTRRTLLAATAAGGIFAAATAAGDNFVQEPVSVAFAEPSARL